ncbi:glycine cleavage system transcriptional repressor [Vibrio sp. UCD-FRSSP16_10]|uniref:glycine cleavage system protein R n=1 Tax=unclassified Vibrio TaxID=2614977 RepID=UPI0007FDEFA4|nr:MULTISPECIES: ACT domain-containing protein [unclassified Vibrio]OBT16918.1 glycine cleavage system transcriptional repressor [Vibrio sp. UCD-FRSSP16_30]OBT21906.1 glycine cleavage system transcriptional repressor [Vibrio sp. UCD-FRSSP16_10]
MAQHLVITAIGTDRPGIGNKIIHLVSELGCNIVDSRIALFGNDFTLIMLISGTLSQITRVEHSLPQLGQQHDLITMVKRTSTHSDLMQQFTLEANIQATDKIGLTEQVTHFFADKDIGISSLSARTLTKESTEFGEDQFQITLSASLSEEYNLMQLQEDFTSLCDSLNVKGTLNFINNG